MKTVPPQLICYGPKFYHGMKLHLSSIRVVLLIVLQARRSGTYQLCYHMEFFFSVKFTGIAR